ncbi:phytanoyl-CoA dioxygenase family protein [Winogradskyella sp. PG-2]|uniref:phytanoyl-CoA dioxygenase family protein n=1 Tax=Winogradskyella sp. PG-2 TaxID=754409 RepID=UPI00045887C5|nr:phytanoyl-CoA dioxygenase family protein [Winogradskyella sp. PG-2]BAO77150.1 hypothetical protein WPG_2920 [Winogradskyella sp. PG-2]
MNYTKHTIELYDYGYSIIDTFYSNEEIKGIISCLESNKLETKSLSKSKKIYAIRQLFKAVPDLKNLVFNQKLINLITSLSETNPFLIKAIFFDKPPESNWFVPYHQDISISVNKKVELNSYKNWTIKKGLYCVQPPHKILEKTITIRIHLDDTNKDNGALKIIPKSHQKKNYKKKYFRLESR